MSATSLRLASTVSASNARKSSRPRRHTPRRRGIQYAAALGRKPNGRGVLDHPPQCALRTRRTMTSSGRHRRTKQEETFRGIPSMKLTFSPASPFARKVRIAAIETGLIDRIEFTPAPRAPGQAHEEYSKITPLKKLPVLILDNGDVILDSYVIVEYLDELAGGGKLIPTSEIGRG